MFLRGLRQRKRERERKRITESNSQSHGETDVKAPKLKILLTLLKLKTNKDMLNKLKSRKLWAAVIGSVIVAIGEQLGLSQEVIQWIATIATGYVVGQGIADAGAQGGSQGS